MQAESIAAKLVASILLAVAACVSFPSHAQTVRYALPHWAGAGRLHGAHFDPRAAIAGALIGGVIAVLSAPPHFDAPHVASPDVPLLHRDPNGSSGPSTSRAASIADGWQQFGESQRDTSNSTSQFVEGWQRFFEASR